MTVQDLMEMLEEFDPAAPVVLSRDAEGNGYAPLEEVAMGLFNKKLGDAYVEDNLGDMEGPFEELDEDTEGDDYISPKNYTPAVILWPGY